MESKKINQLATNLAPLSTDLTIVGDPITGVSKKITLSQIANLFAGSIDFYANLAAFPVTGTINIIYCAKDTQKLYLWSGSAYVETFPSQSVLDTYQLLSAKGVANGYASLDSGGKVPIAQLPSSIMEYKGLWSAATNTPTLANGTGDTGDVYICNAAGSVNFGAGAITFAVGDYVIYSGTIWQRSSGAVGTVTSVGLSTNGGALTIGNSPITTSGVISANFNGTSGQYINGAGNLVTFPTIASEAQRLITEVYNSTGATLTKGTVVYINGGQGNLPTVTKAIATGDATSAQTYGIVQTDITNMNNGYVVVVGSLMDLDTQAYAAGTQLYLSSTVAGQWTSVKQYAPAHLVYVGIVVRSHPTQGVVEVRIQNGFEMDELHNVSAQSPSNNQGLFYNTSTSLWENKSIATALGYTPADDSLVVKLAGTQTITGAKTFSTVSTFDIGLVMQTGYYPTPALGYVGLGSNGSGITILTKPVSTVYNNNLQFSAASNTYNFPNATGTLALTSDLSSYVPYTGATTNVDLGNNSLKSRSLHLKQNDTINVAGVGYGTIATNTIQQFVFYWEDATYAKRFNLDFSALSPLGSALTYTLPNASGTIALVGGSGVGTVTSVAALTIGTSGTDLSSSVANSTTTPVITLNVPTASATNRGALSSADWTTFNNKQSALTNPVTGTGTTNYLPKFTGASTIGNSLVYDNGSGVGIGTTVINYNLQIGLTSDASSTINVISSTSGFNRLLFSDTNNGQGGLIYRHSTDTLSFIANDSERMHLNSTGNLGLGVTPSAWSTGNDVKAFQLGGDLVLWRYGTAPGSIYLGNNYYWNGTNRVYLNSGFASEYVQSEGKHIWNTAPSGTGNVTFTQAMTLLANGNVLIGTTTDNTGKLQVNGEIRMYGSTLFRGMSSNTLQLCGGTSSSNVKIDGSVEVITMDTNGATRLTIASTGAATFTGNVTAPNLYAGSGTGAPSVQVFGGASSNSIGGSAYITLQDVTNTRFWGLQADASQKLNFWHFNGGWSSVANISSTGAATFSSTCTATGFFESSDNRLKTLIQDNYQTKGIASITPKLYTKNGKVELGYYAQDFVGILDSAVSKGSDDMLSLSYREVLVAKVYALEQEIKELKAK